MSNDLQESEDDLLWQDVSDNKSANPRFDVTLDHNLNEGEVEELSTDSDKKTLSDVYSK